MNVSYENSPSRERMHRSPNRHRVLSRKEYQLKQIRLSRRTKLRLQGGNDLRDRP